MRQASEQRLRATKSNDAQFVSHIRRDRDLQLRRSRRCTGESNGPRAAERRRDRACTGFAVEKRTFEIQPIDVRSFARERCDLIGLFLRDLGLDHLHHPTGYSASANRPISANVQRHKPTERSHPNAKVSCALFGTSSRADDPSPSRRGMVRSYSAQMRRRACKRVGVSVRSHAGSQSEETRWSTLQRPTVSS